MTRYAAILLLVALSGCSGSTDSSTAVQPSSPKSTSNEVTASTSAAASPSPDTVDETPAVRAAAQAYSDAFLTGDSDAAFALLSTRCQERLGKPAFAAVVTQAGQAYGTALAFETFGAEVSGDLARVTYTYAEDPSINQDSEPWVREGGAWHEDDC
jgi:hypothetical protein